MAAVMCGIGTAVVLPTNVQAIASASTETIITPIIFSDNIYPNAERGLPYHISCHPDTVELTFVFDDWIDEKSGTINLYKNPVSGRMENALFDEEGEVTEGEYFVIRENGEFVFTAKIVTEDDESYISTELIVSDVIDYKPPKLDMAKENLLLTGSRPIGYEFMASDIYSSLPKPTRYSGLDTIIVFYDKDNQLPSEWDVPDQLTPEDLENSDQLTVIKSEKGISKPNAPVYERYFTFNFQGDGGYWVYLRDRAGNSYAERIWEQDSGLEYIVNIDGTNINVAPAFDIIYDQIVDGQGKYTQEILDNLEQARYDLIYAFQTNASEQEVKSRYNTLRAAQTAYTEAKVSYTLNVVNASMYPFDITVTNLGQSTVSALLGDSVNVAVTVTESTSGDWFTAAVNASDIARANKVYNLSYSLTKNNQPIALTAPLKFHIAIPLRYEKIVVLSPNITGGYIKEKAQIGEEWIEFTTSYTTQDYVLVAYDNTELAGKPNLLWLYITLGVLGGAAATAGVFIVLKRRTSLPKSQEQESDNNKNADSGSTAPSAKPKTASNKSKKKKKSDKKPSNSNAFKANNNNKDR